MPVASEPISISDFILKLMLILLSIGVVSLELSADSIPLSSRFQFLSKWLLWCVWNVVQQEQEREERGE